MTVIFSEYLSIDQLLLLIVPTVHYAVFSMIPKIFAVLLLAAISTTVLAQSETPAGQRCEQLAAHPYEPGRDGIGVEWGRVDVVPAVEACRAALEQHPDSPEIQYRLGRTLLQAGSYDEAFSLLFASANSGYTPAQVAYGTAFDEGQGVAIDDSVALEWLTKAAKGGHPIGIYNLGLLYGRGRGVENDPRVAARLYIEAAEAGYPKAMFALALAYEEGAGVAQDYKQASHWFEQAAAYGDPGGFYGYTRGIELGHGQQQDAPRAFEFWLSSAQGGDLYSMVRAGAAYEEGRGTTRNIAKALEFYGYAARSVYGPAELHLGRLLLREAKTPDETADGISWLRRAALNEQNEAYMILAEHYRTVGDIPRARDMAQLVLHYTDGVLEDAARALLSELPSKDRTTSTVPALPKRSMSPR